MKNGTRKFFAAVCLVIATVLWGGGFVAVKDSLHFIRPYYMIALRFLAASFFLSVIFFKSLVKTNRKTVLHGFLLAIVLFLAYVFQTVGLQTTTAGKNAFLTTVYVILVPLIAWFVYRQNPGVHVFAAAAVAIFGIALLSLGENFTINKGDVFTLICGFWFAMHLVFIAHFTQKHDTDPIALTILQMFFCSVFAWIAAPFFDGEFPISAVTNLHPLLSLGYLAVFSGGIAFLLQNIGQKYLAANTAALFLSLESVFGAFFSVLFLGETMSLRMIAGCALLLFAIVLSETKLAFLRRKR